MLSGNEIHADKTLQIAERHSVYFAIEPHQSLTKTTEGLLRIVDLLPLSVKCGTRK